MNEIVFYTNPMSRGQIVRWALEEVRADYEQVIVQYGPDMKNESYLSVNPMGKVPAIVHNGKAVTECSAICAYLADAFPAANLAPALQDRHDYYRWLFFAAGPVESAVINNTLGFHTDEEQTRMAGYGSYDLVMTVLDDLLRGRPYVCGDTFTMADVYLGSHVDWGLAFKSIPERASFNAYVQRLQQRDAYKKAKEIDAALIAQAN